MAEIMRDREISPRTRLAAAREIAARAGVEASPMTPSPKPPFNLDRLTTPELRELARLRRKAQP